MQSLIGTGVALVTPFRNDFSVDVEALQDLVEYTTARGVEYLVVLGTTGESATLSNEEKQLVKRTVIKANKQRLPLVLGVGGNNTQAVLEELNEENLEGFDAILSVSPYYNKPTQEGIYQHFKQIALKSLLPIILYNVPGRTGSNMAVSTVVRLANEFSNIIGIKEAAGSMVQGMELIRQSTRKEFLVISGDDAIALPLVLAGGAGVISVIGQGVPQKFTDMIRFGLKGNVKEAFELQYQLMPIIDMIFEQGNPAGIKEILKVEGVMGNTLRLPLVPVDAELASRIDKEYKSLN
ncbi:4-hydroxy-tetrahydrodipicolinate synthase [Myroides sp. M-43]|uniref:4-hydroxy-tetrahydrodipicolinate synthase n=1 Tax=Myroides oncorhynchi TaxID=2893756 RepID=UPI001E546AD6|nr:4-hydroxy-tetrahydrodipicolinate synthase [Myroides oncorhynchi]MCC9041446.1 4-hydroxy-tetrahydrodipicolinate synthase [Myroides oncorhynchi]